MSEITRSSSGLLIAYLLPGFTLLWSSRDVPTTVEQWLATAPRSTPIGKL